MYIYTKENINKINVVYVTSDDIERHNDTFKLDERYASCSKFYGIRSHHAFIPNSSSLFTMKRVSTNQQMENINLSDKQIRHLILLLIQMN